MFNSIIINKFNFNKSNVIQHLNNFINSNYFNQLNTNPFCCNNGNDSLSPS